MTTANVNRSMVQHLSRKLIPLSTCIALLIAVLAPVTFWLHAHLNLQRLATLYAEDLTGQLRQVIQESPTPAGQMHLRQPRQCQARFPCRKNNRAS